MAIELLEKLEFFKANHKRGNYIYIYIYIYIYVCIYTYIYIFSLCSQLFTENEDKKGKRIKSDIARESNT